MKKVLSSFLLIGLATGPMAAANPIGDFFKKIGNSISKLHKSPPPKQSLHKKSAAGKENSAQPREQTAGSPSASPAITPTPTPTPLEIRPAALAPPTRAPRDVPFGVAVPNKPGFVTSPYAPSEGYVDVRAFPPSTEVLDPFTGKIFLTP